MVLLLRSYILVLPFTPCTIYTCIHGFCCLHSAFLSAFLTVDLQSLLTVSENDAMVKRGVKRVDKILDLLQKKSPGLQSDQNFYPEAA